MVAPGPEELVGPEDRLLATEVPVERRCHSGRLAGAHLGALVRYAGWGRWGGRFEEVGAETECVY